MCSAEPPLWPYGGVADFLQMLTSSPEKFGVNVTGGDIAFWLSLETYDAGVTRGVNAGGGVS